MPSGPAVLLYFLLQLQLYRTYVNLNISVSHMVYDEMVSTIYKLFISCSTNTHECDIIKCIQMIL